MLIRVNLNDKEKVTWAKKHNLSIVKAVVAGRDNIAADAGIMSQGDYEEWREGQREQMSDFWSFEAGSPADKDYLEIHRRRIKPICNCEPDKRESVFSEDGLIEWCDTCGEMVCDHHLRKFGKHHPSFVGPVQTAIGKR